MKIIDKLIILYLGLITCFLIDWNIATPLMVLPFMLYALIYLVIRGITDNN